MSGTENQFSLTRAASKPPARQKTTFLSVSVHLTFAGLLAITTNVPAATLYVSPQAPHAAAPYATWDTAATTIQQAVDSANPGDEIVVTNGTYATGGRAVFGAMTNRVAVDKPLTLRSTNGRAVTIIQGVMAPGGGNGDGAVRCMYLTNGVVLSGFTLTNGATRAAGDADLEQSSGGLWCESTSVMISDCVIAGNSGAGYCGGVYSGTLTNCTIATNDGGGTYDAVLNDCTLTGNHGGGASRGTLNNCQLIGNSADYGGGASRATLNNCTLSGNRAVWGGGAVYGGSLSNCTLTGNSASSGGSGGGAAGAPGVGMYCTLNNCTLTGNSAGSGGGAEEGTLNHCTLLNNWATDSGGGADWSQLNACGLTGNSASMGGGACNSTLNECLLTGNTASSSGGGVVAGGANNCTFRGNSAPLGGGAWAGTHNNCVLTENSAHQGGGAADAWLNNCTLVGNSADIGGGAADSLGSGTLNNCILYHNRAVEGANYFNDNESLTLNYCCTTPLPAGGTGNIILEPQLASASHLSVDSPCRGAGSSDYASGTDIDGESWATPPSIGCDEIHTGAVTGPLGVSIAAGYTNVAAGFSVELTALIEGRATGSVWDFGDGVVVTNRPFATHAWTAAGDYPVVLRVFNESYPAGVSATVVIQVREGVCYVSALSGNPVAPYSSWATAARNIQDAVDAATVPGALVLVTNGTYATGGRAVDGNMTNRVAITKLLRVWSVNGPDVTIIQGRQVPGTGYGAGAVRCVYLTNGASLSGFALTGGATLADGDPDTELSGGGAWCAGSSSVVSNCTLIGNSAAVGGGGAYHGTFYNSIFVRNSSGSWAGGAGESTLYNCALTGNLAEGNGGGAGNCTLLNCNRSRVSPAAGEFIGA